MHLIYFKWEEGCQFITLLFLICCNLLSFKVMPQYKHSDWIQGIVVPGNATAPGKDASH